MSTIWLLDDGGATLGGGQLFALKLARHAGRPVRLVCPRDSPLWRAATDLDRVASPFPAPVAANALGLGRAALSLRRTLTGADRDDVVVSGSIRAGMLAGIALAARSGSPPLVHLLHERDSASRWSVRLALRRSRHVLAVGPQAAAAYRAALPGANVGEVENFLAPDELERLVAARRARGAPARVLGVLARLIPEKGIHALVDELAVVPQSWSELLVGGPRQDEDYASALDRRIAAAGLGERVRLLGTVDDVPAFLARLDALVVPSTGNENQPTVILEALAAGVPVIVRRPLWSHSFDRLPVLAYATPDELAAALATPAAPADPQLLATRFGPRQVVDAIDAIACR